jgi:LPXTG-motif cell wall-anchored protein
MRNFTSACAVTAAAAACLLLSPSAYASPPGDNGTVKIHDAKTGEELRKNEPHVCGFYLDAFGFDGAQQVAWKIVEMPPTGTKGTEAKSGDLTLDGSGHGRTDDMTLPNGHYKLVWNFDNEHGSAKHKVFWTDCKNDGGTAGGGSGSGGSSSEPSQEPSGSATDKPTQQPSGQPSGQAADGSTSSASAAPAPTSDGGKGNLAETGASVVGVSVAAVVLLGAGGVLVMRRRARGQG